MDSTNRIFRCLEALDAAERPMSLPELHAQIPCPRSSLAATLRSLVGLGYLHHDRARRTYSPTLLLADLGGWVATRVAPSADVLLAARAIRDTTGCNVAIAHRNDIRLQYLHFLPGYGLEPAVRVGTTRLLCRSVIGWALLSMLHSRVVQGIVKRTNATLASEDRVDSGPLLAMVERCQTDGYVSGESLARVGYHAVAMPLRMPNVDLAIAVSSRSSELAGRQSEVADIMKDALAAVAS